jgi:hypothetical protein
MILGNVTFVSTFVVLIRRHFFRRTLADVVQNSRVAQQHVDDIDQHEQARKRIKPEASSGSGVWDPNSCAEDRKLSENQGRVSAMSSCILRSASEPGLHLGKSRV